MFFGVFGGSDCCRLRLVNIMEFFSGAFFFVFLCVQLRHIFMECVGGFWDPGLHRMGLGAFHGIFRSSAELCEV